MKVFLSGKVDAGDGKWRDLLLGEQWAGNRKSPRWELVHKADLFDHPFAPWPVLHNTVMGTHDYLGPYRQTIEPDPGTNKSMEYFHGVDSRGQHGQMDWNDQQAIVALCMKAIDSCDMLFAYLNTKDCYGTICEIGYARARNKFIAVVIPPDLDADDMWFATLMANYYYSSGREDLTEKEHLERAFLEAVSSFVARPTKQTGALLERLVFSHGR